MYDICNMIIVNMLLGLERGPGCALNLLIAPLQVDSRVALCDR